MSCGFFQSTLVIDMKENIEEIIRIYSPTVVHIISSSDVQIDAGDVLIRVHMIDMSSPKDVKREMFRIAKFETEISSDYRVNFDITGSSDIFKESALSVAPIFGKEKMRVSELIEGDIEFIDLPNSTVNLTHVQYLKALNSIRGVKTTGGKTISDQEALYDLLRYRGLIEKDSGCKASYLSRHVTTPLKSVGWITNKGNSGTKYMASELGKEILYIYDFDIDESDVYEERRERGFPETGESLKRLADDVYEAELTSNGDYERAYPMYEKAAKKGNPDAYERLGIRYIDSDDPEEKEKGLNYLIMAAENGSGEGCYVLGLYYLEGEVVPKNIDNAVFYLEKGMSLGDWACASALGKYYDSIGNGHLAGECFRRLLEIDIHCILNIPKNYHNEKFFKDALNKYKILAEGCDECATMNLAQMHINGEIVKKDLDIAMHLLKKLDDPFAYLSIADIYEDEEYSGYDPKKADEYRKRTDGLYERMQEQRKEFEEWREHFDESNSFRVAPDGSLIPNKRIEPD